MVTRPARQPLSAPLLRRKHRYAQRGWAENTGRTGRLPNFDAEKLGSVSSVPRTSLSGGCCAPASWHVQLIALNIEDAV